MQFEWHRLVLLTCSAFIFVNVGAKTAEATSSPDQQQLAPAPLAQPEVQGDTLTPQQKEHLIIDEENVFDVDPPG